MPNPFLYILLVLLKTIRFSISTHFSSFCPIDRTLSGVTILGQRGNGSDVNEEVLSISQSSSITGTSPSDCLVSYPEHSFGESYLYAEMQSYILRIWATETLNDVQYESRYHQNIIMVQNGFKVFILFLSKLIL